MSEKQKTAVEWLEEQITYDDFGKRWTLCRDDTDITDLIEKAKEIEKQQIISACEYADPNHDGIGEYYYQKTFTNESQN
jgi:hypothetical protein